MNDVSRCELRIIGGADVIRLVPMTEVITLVEKAMRTVSSNGALLPLRTVMMIPDSSNMFGVMPGYLSSPASLGAKIVAVYPANAARGLSSHMGVVLLFDPETGVPTAIIDATEVTARRTAAASAVATRALARPDAKSLAILGTGEQAGIHLEAMLLVRPIDTIRVWGRSADKAREFAQIIGKRLDVEVTISPTVRDAVASADIVCTTTSSREPILKGEWLAPGTHVNLVGASVASAREADDEVVARSRFYVDFRPSALAQAGELLGAIKAGRVDERHIVGEIGDVLNGRVGGRASADEITVYKSLGIAAQDLALGSLVYQRAVQQDVGTRAPL